VVQGYSMHLGPWASDTAYLVHLGCAAFTLVGLAVLLRRRRETEDVEMPGFNPVSAGCCVFT
jgi:hypothetical protein